MKHKVIVGFDGTRPRPKATMQGACGQDPNLR